ncbi:hypothetical protein EDD11_008666 [Mortierella claussenii]|nr:hypothetical protein EDD11_008666 [Mortierella claussenii]
MVISPHTAGIHPQSVGNPRTPAFGTTARCANEKAYGAMLDHWLQSAVPKTLSTFSISNSFDFGLNGMICLPSALTTLNITRCPKITGGVLAMGFQHLSNLVSLTMCSDLLFTDESFLIALSTLGCLRRLIYIYPCDPVQPPWRDLFRYCSSCELYHRRVATKTYTRRLLVPELPSQIQELRLEMDEAKYKHVRIDTYEQSQHGFDRTDRTKFSFSLWKAEAVDESDMTASWRGFAASPSSAKGLRSWWPENLTRLNLSKCSITNSRFDVPSNLKELVICYPLEPNEMNVDETIVKLSEDKQWFPDSMMSIEVLGVPYHVSCELQNNPNERALGWIEYTNKMLKMVPRQLERLVVNCLQVPDEDSLNLMQRRVGRTLKTWVVRILCPQRPKVSGFSASHLYSPIIHFDSDEEGLWGYNDDFSSDDSWDSESDDDSIPESPSARSCRRTRELHYRAFNEGRANIRQSWEMAAVEQYDVTPVRLREATRGLAVLSQMEVGLNSQHFRFCRAVWKDALSLVDQSPTKAVMDNEVAGISVVNGASGQMLFRKRQKIERNPFLSSHVDRKGKGRAEDQAGSPSIFMMPPDMKGKGKGKKLDFETDFSPQPFTSSSNRRGDFGSKRTWDDRGQDENRSTQSHSILGHGRQAGLKVEIQYWDNSCCGKQCLGHARNQQD